MSPMKPVDTAIKVIVGPLIDDTDFKAREESVVFNAAGMEIDVIMEKTDGTVTTTAVVPTVAGAYDWAHTDQGYYELELPASAGANYNNTEEGILTVVGYCTGVLPFRSVSYDIVPVTIYNSLITGSDYLQVDTVQVEGSDATNQIRDSVVDDATRIDASSINAVEAKVDAIDTNVDAILVDTAEIGAAGAGLSAVPWNGAWDAEVQSEVDDALVARNLDHLLAVATAAADMTAEVVDNSVLSRILANGDTSNYVPSTDSLQIIRDKETDIETDTTEIGAAGAGLSAVPWNSNWDTEVQSEVDDALVANNLDHLMKTATGGADMTTEVVDNTVLSRILANGDTSNYVPSTDSLQLIRDKLTDIEADTNELQTDDYPTRFDNIDTDLGNIETDTQDLQTQVGTDGAGLNAIPWNSSWDTEVQSECTDALNAYDPPTKGELDSGLAGLNDLSAAQVNTEIDTALSDINLDHLLKTATVGADMTAEMVDNTILSRILANGDTSNYVPSTDSLQVIRDKLTDIEADTNELQTDDYPTRFDTVDANLSNIETDTQDLQTQIGTDGDGLNAIPWNSSWDAEVQSEATDALNAYDPPTKTELDSGFAGLNDLSAAQVNTEIDTALSDINLDHLLKTATVGADMTAEVADNTIVSRILANGDTSNYIPSTDSLQVIRDKETDIEADTQDIQTQIGVDGAGLNAIPWNSSWDAEVQSEATDALNAYDPPTKTEMDSGFAALNDINAAQVEAACDASLVSYDPPTKTELDSGLAGLNDLNAAQIEAACDASLVSYDPPTKAELDTAESNIRGTDSDDLKDLSDALDNIQGATFNATTDSLEAIRDRGDAAWTTGAGSNADLIADAVWDELISGHTNASTFGGEIQSHATPSEVNTQATAALNSYDPPTKTEMDSGFAALNDLNSADVNTACTTALNAYDPPTKTELDTGFAALNDLNASQVEAACDASLVSYDPPTKAELDTAESNIRGADSDDLKTLSDALDTILTDTGTTLDALIKKALGLSQENFYIDQTVFDANGNMTSCRIRTYSVAGSVGTVNDVLATYTVTATYSGSEMSSYKVVAA